MSDTEIKDSKIKQRRKHAECRRSYELRYYAFKPERSLGIGVKKEAGMTQEGVGKVGYKTSNRRMNT